MKLVSYICRFKLICNGTIIKEDIPLSQQGVKNGNQFLCLVLNQSVTVMQEQEQQQKDIEATKADTSLLAADNSYMHVSDVQSKNSREVINYLL